MTRENRPAVPNFQVKLYDLVPYTKEAHELMSKFSEGDVVDVDVLNPRHTKFNNLVHATIDKVAKATGLSHQAVQAQLMIATGRFDILKVSGTKRVLVLRSMHRRAMSDSELRRFWEDASKHILENILPRLPNGDVEEIRQMIQGDAHVSTPHS